jgi:hypothetical protein
MFYRTWLEPVSLIFLCSSNSQTYFVNGQIVNILGFGGHRSFTTTQTCKKQAPTIHKQMNKAFVNFIYKEKGQ